MGLAMRVARYFPTVVIGAASLASQFCMPQSCLAWESIPASALKESYDLEGSSVISDTRRSACRVLRLAPQDKFRRAILAVPAEYASGR